MQGSHKLGTTDAKSQPAPNSKLRLVCCTTYPICFYDGGIVQTRRSINVAQSNRRVLAAMLRNLGDQTQPTTTAYLYVHSTLRYRLADGCNMPLGQSINRSLLQRCDHFWYLKLSVFGQVCSQLAQKI